MKLADKSSCTSYIFMTIGYTEESVLSLVPSEFAIGGIYFPPLLIASMLGVVATALTAALLNRYRLSRFFFYPPLVFLALAVIYSGLINTCRRRTSEASQEPTFTLDTLTDAELSGILLVGLTTALFFAVLQRVMGGPSVQVEAGHRVISHGK